MLRGVDLSKSVEYFHRNEHILPVSHERMLSSRFEVEKAVEAFSLLGRIGIHDWWIAILGEPDLLERRAAREHHLIFAEDDSILIFPGPHERRATICLLGYPGGFPLLIGLLIAFAWEVEAKLRFFEEQVATGSGLVVLPGQYTNVFSQ